MADNSDPRVMGKQGRRGRGSVPAFSHRFHKGWLIVEALLLVTVVLLFNILPERAGILATAKNPSSTVPLLAPGFAEYLLWLNLWLGLALNLNIVKLIHGRWHTGIRWADFGLSLLGVLVLIRIVTGGTIVSLNPVWAAAQNSAGVSVATIEQQLVPLLSASIRVALIAALIGLALASIQKFRQLIRDLRLEPFRSRSRSTTG